MWVETDDETSNGPVVVIGRDGSNKGSLTPRFGSLVVEISVGISVTSMTS